MTKKRNNSYTPAMMAQTKLQVARQMEKDPVFKKRVEEMIEGVKQRNADTEEKI